MVVEHNLVLSMPSIVVLGAWLVLAIIRFGGDLASLIWTPVMKEPNVCDSSAGVDNLITDLYVRGAWEPQTEALFDIRVIDTDAWSFRAHTPCDALYTAEGEKKRKYLQVCQNVVVHDDDHPWKLAKIGAC